MYEHVECSKGFIAEGLNICSEQILWCDSNRQNYEPNTPQYKLWDARLMHFYDEANILIEKYFNAQSERTAEGEDK